MAIYLKNRMTKLKQRIHTICYTITLAMIVALSSCATRKVVEYRDRDVNHYITNVVHDTLIGKEKDSVYVDVFVKGDTVFKIKYKERLVQSERIVVRHDTCWRDSVVVQYKETKVEKKKNNKIQYIAFAICFFFVIFAISKLKRWL